ncbi:MAG TPA: TIGR02757 family protein [Syntrophorhabdaceae bacterium]|nr:TIGR02757 family protein [Syntrophorhabdaceae bacterium]
MDIIEAFERDKPKLIEAKRNDPVIFLDDYNNKVDIEIAGFIASQFAYGRIEVFMRFLKDLFEKMGKNPHKFINIGDFSCLTGLYYRFQKDKDIIMLFYVLKKIMDEFGDLGNMLKNFYNGDMRKALWSVRTHIFGKRRELTFFFPEPSPTNPMKRWSLFLRWMVRKDEIDKGIWDFIDKKDLLVPLDANIFKIGRCLGWTKEKIPSYKAALHITEALKRLSPHDPLKFDFFLCHRVGIAAGCKGTKSENCKDKCLIYR